jgi:hypothetical protein
MSTVFSYRRAVLSVALAVIMLGIQQSHAALITWDTPLAVDKDVPAQVLTTGTLVAVGARQSTNETVNGVTFLQFGAVGSNVNYSNNSGVANDDGYGPDGVTPGPDDTSYARLLSTGVYRTAGDVATILITGLNSGTQYDVQLFTPFWGDTAFETQFSDGTNTVDMGNTGLQPTYVIGHFTAGGGSQSIFFTAASGSDHGLLGAAQVRAVPEPASALSLGLAILALRYRRRAR